MIKGLASEDTHTGHTRILLQQSFNASREKDDQLLGRRPRTQETRSLNRPRRAVGDVSCPDWLLTISPDDARDRQGTRNGKIPQHTRRLFVYQLEHRISAPSCNSDCKGSSSQHPTYHPSPTNLLLHTFLFRRVEASHGYQQTLEYQVEGYLVF